MDAIIGVIVPRSKEDFRIIDANSYARADMGLSLEDALEDIEQRPGAAEGEDICSRQGSMAVTTELPVLSPKEVKERVGRAIRLCEQDARLILFTSNIIF
jgi:hypothetical protein